MTPPTKAFHRAYWVSFQITTLALGAFIGWALASLVRGCV